MSKGHFNKADFDNQFKGTLKIDFDDDLFLKMTTMSQCDHCGIMHMTLPKILTCAGCRGFHYCSKHSQKKFWKLTLMSIDNEVGEEDVNLRKQRKRQHRKVGREEEGSSSNRPELVAFVLALRGTPVAKSMLYLCDNQVLLKTVKRWVSEGGKATLVGAPDADILLEAIKEFGKRTTAGALTLLVKVKAHRGEPANEEANIQADKAIAGKDVPTECHDTTNQTVCTWQEPRRKRGTVRYED